MIYEKAANVLLSIVFMCAFLGIFFFTYAARIERNIVKNQSERIIADLTQDLSALLTQDQLVDLKTVASPYIVSPNLSQEDEEVKESNKNLMKQATIAITVFVVVGLCTVFMLTRIGDVSLKSIFIRNLITLVFIAITEFCFLTYFVQNYVTIDSNFVKYKVLTTLADVGS